MKETKAFYQLKDLSIFSDPIFCGENNICIWLTSSWFPLVKLRIINANIKNSKKHFLRNRIFHKLCRFYNKHLKNYLLKKIWCVSHI